MKTSLREAANIIKQFKRKSLLTKYFITFFLSLVIPISFLIAVMYYTSQSSAKNELGNFAIQSTVITANTLNTSLDSFHNDYLIYLDDYNVQNFLAANTDDVSKPNAFMDISKIREKMNLHMLSSTYLDSVYLYSFKNNYVITNTSGNQIDRFGDTEWLNYYNRYKQNYFITPQKSPYNHISICYELNDGNHPTGLIIFNFDLSRFRQTLFSEKNSSITSAILYSNIGEPIFVLGKDLNQFDNIKNKLKSDTNQQIQLDVESNYIHCYSSLERTNDILQVSFSTNNLSMKNKYSTLFFVLGLIISLLLAGFLSIYLSFKFYNSISGIIMQITESDIGNSASEEHNEKKFDEISFISQNLSRLIMKHSMLEDDLYHKIANLKRMQIMTLQSQLNPHFIFNTLNHISILTLDAGEKGELANSIISNLSELLRSSLANKQNIVDAKTEIDYTKKYLEIEKIKYSDKFDVKWDIDKRVLTCAVAKFMLQPIVENSFIHGIHKVNAQKGLLSISAQVKNESIIFQIKDNGAGISSVNLEKIREKLKTDDLPDAEHIGLCNVHQRIKLIFGEEYGITKIDSRGGETTVEITLPKQEYN
ncbi:MAG: histidine kinase [Clostridia bacterium]|nr:histidine kinase [Clostridia bacterium]